MVQQRTIQAMNTENMWNNSGIPFDRVKRIYVSVGNQPGWVTRAALIAGTTVTLAILLILIIPALIVAVAVFFLLAMWVKLQMWLAGVRSKRDGRRNVIVISRDPHDPFV